MMGRKFVAWAGGERMIRVGRFGRPTVRVKG